MIANDSHRPRYHFSPDNWMNDPIPFFWNGAYHIFFQHNPHAAVWGDMHWGHAVSRDLVHWERLPNALAPTPNSPDQAGIYTGCVIEDKGTFYAFYTGVASLDPLEQTQCLATSRDLITWQKYPGNPLIALPPDGYGLCFRDPQVWREKDGWYMVVGGEQRNGAGGAAFLYRSDNLLNWQPLPPLALGVARETNSQFECPDFFALGHGHVLLSSSGQTWWQAGDYSNHRFTPRTHGPTDESVFYAGKTLSAQHGRRLLFGWLRETRPEAEQVAAGWSGVLSLPRVLTLRRQGMLGMDPPPELQSLRGAHTSLPPTSFPAGRHLLPQVSGDCLEIAARFAPTQAPVGLSVRCLPDGTGGVDIVYDPQTGRLGDVPLTLAEHEGLSLQIFVDRSVVEVFTNSRACRTWRIYPDAADAAVHVAVLAPQGAVQADNIAAWEMTGTMPV